MSDLKFTGGSVTFERNVKVADYESKKLAITLNFGADDELTDEQLGQAADHCIRLVEEKLGLRKPAPASQVAALPSSQQPAASNANAVQSTAPTTVTPAATPPKRRGPAKPPVIEVKIDPAEIADAVAARGAISETPEDRIDPNNSADVVDDSSSHGAGTAEVVDSAASSAVEGDPAGIDEDILGAAAPDVTDSDLVDAITRKNAQIKNPIAIRQCIGGFVSPPKQARDIPQTLRADFLKKLAAL